MLYRSLLSKMSWFKFNLLLLCLIFLVLSLPKLMADSSSASYVIRDTRNLDSLNGGAVEETIKLDNRDVTIYGPEVNDETLDIKPRPQRLLDAINHPGIFFKKDAERAIQDFQKFAEDYRKCVSSQKWPLNFNCFKRMDICFGKFDSFICGWQYHRVFSNCASQNDGGKALTACLSRDEKMFNKFNKCFDKDINFNLMFDIYSGEAKLREYYTIDTSYYNDESTQDTITCRFTFMNEMYHIIKIYGPDVTIYRPGLTVIPKDTYLENNYHKNSNERLKKFFNKKNK